ncbi:putative DsbA family dithiol-disulfide isomerase [Luteibacter jiangsuensis]|uniref:DsbA family dithiol-disulfide isomerase n=1 Tax=Luteibacter jiangsuensis TaxID=637577 RepID=A0ABT9SWR3_9GAMM|nr:DsbA family oxidoreductase [Luteibacter jiangsuensis]MDQ0008407.1 putative DsbA family dithiol-disulfide isomerase [Luteibacter jiangsuensis]
MRIPIHVTSDFICPWCYIGEKRLQKAIQGLPADIEVDIRWLPFELNPDMPVDGLDRKAYRSRKFGSLEISRRKDAQTVEAGRPDGAVFDYDAIERTPNTLLAHRAAAFAKRSGKQHSFVEAAFHGYFAEGRDIGTTSALLDIASEVGLDREALLAFLDTDEGIDEIRALENAAMERGISAVPLIEIDGIAITGAQSPEIIRKAILDAGKAT